MILLTIIHLSWDQNYFNKTEDELEVATSIQVGEMLEQAFGRKSRTTGYVKNRLFTQLADMMITFLVFNRSS